MSDNNNIYWVTIESRHTGRSFDFEVSARSASEARVIAKQWHPNPDHRITQVNYGGPDEPLFNDFASR